MAARRCARSSRCRPRSSARRSCAGAPRSRSTRYLPKLCSGEWLGCFGLTEPDTGSDAANQKTRATRTDDGWVISGAKMWISMGNHAKVALVFAQTDPELGHRGIACFLVDTDQPGFTSQEIHGKMGLHGSDTASIALDEVQVPEDAHARRGRRRLQDRDELAGLRPLQRGRRLRGHLPGLRRGVGRLRQGARAVRPADRVLPARPGDDRRHGRADRRGPDAHVARGLPQGRRSARTRPRPRSPSSTRPRPARTAPTWRSRSTAAPATSTTTRSSATTATCA